MRRLVANSLLLIFFGVLVAPMAPAAASNNLPECCRRGGAHHCAAMAASLTGETTFRSQSNCPMQNRGHVAATSAALPVSASAWIAAEVQHLSRAVLSRPLLSAKDGGRERAPPINS